MSASEHLTIRSRYILLEKLNEGEQNVVYLCRDRLNNQVVALKQFAAPVTSEQDEALQQVELLVLASEFRLLASLRHPHIISVLDYGFNERQQPFMVMEYLEGAKNFLAACAYQPAAAVIRLVGQVLEALVYLHRRGLEHGDLQPGNVLVSGGRAKLMNLGMMLRQQQNRQLAYMAPEVLAGKRTTPASDLYAVGVLAYEGLCGQKPAYGADGESLDLSALGAISPVLAQVLGRLLAFNPEERFPDAQAAIMALLRPIGVPVLAQDSAIRDSFLKAAEFVGRKDELDQLLNALEQAAEGHGSAWIVGGESGIGKTRLLEEVRIRALARGALVLRGQADEGLGQPYQLWREPLRRLALILPLTNLQAGVIKPLVPDLEMLLERPVSEAPQVDAADAQKRLIQVIQDLLHAAARQLPPLVLLLEDLQWAVVSLEPLKTLSRLVERLPILVIGAYRSDERPDLQADLPAMRPMSLGRLDRSQIEQLSFSMLGNIGRRPEMVDFLERETEGNVFFLVETVRALVEEAGSLAALGTVIPFASIFTHEEQRIVNRRLSQVPYADRPLLEIAAISGRIIDPKVLGILAPTFDMESWLARGARVAVLEVFEGGWRFEHDKLRDALLTGMDRGRKAELHRRVAFAIEVAYPGNENFAPQLFEHWDAAGDAARAITYALRAGRRAANSYAHDDALRYFSRGLALISQHDLNGRFELLLEHENILYLMADRKAQRQDVDALETLAEAIGDSRTRAIAALQRARLAWVTGDFTTVVRAAKSAIVFAGDAGADALLARGYWNLGRVFWRRGEYLVARQHIEQALNLARNVQDRQLEADALRILGTLIGQMGDLEASKLYHEQALQVCRDINDRLGEAALFNNLGYICSLEDDLEGAQIYCQQTLNIQRQIGFRQGEMVTLNTMGELLIRQGHYIQAMECFEMGLNINADLGNQGLDSLINANMGNALQILGEFEAARSRLEYSLSVNRRIGERQDECVALAYLSSVYFQQDNLLAAQGLAQQSAALAKELRSPLFQKTAFLQLGHAMLGLGRIVEALDAYRQAEIAQRQLPALQAVEAWAGIAQALFAQGHLTQARMHVEQALPHLARITRDGADAPLRAHMGLYRVSQMLSDMHAAQVLQQAHTLLLELAERISNASIKRSFLECVPWNREILIEWEKRKGAQAVNVVKLSGSA